MTFFYNLHFATGEGSYWATNLSMGLKSSLREITDNLFPIITKDIYPQRRFMQREFTKLLSQLKWYILRMITKELAYIRKNRKKKMTIGK